MKRGRIFIYLALIIIIAVAAGGGYVWMHRNSASQSAASQVTPQITYVEIVTAGQSISAGTRITEAMLSTIQIPQTALVQGEFSNKADVVNMYAQYSLIQGVPITASLVSKTPGINLPGSSWAPSIPQGLTAVAIPINRLSSIAYGLRDGDRVNVIVTMLLVDVDTTNQSALPNFTASVIAPGIVEEKQQLVAQILSGGEVSRVGSSSLDESLGQPLYLVPSEGQRPRMVTQMIMQNIEVLHVGNFSDEDKITTEAGATPTPSSNEQQATPVPATNPDVVTLIVSPDDANTLVYLIYSGAKITLTLRNPDDTGEAVKTDAAMLEYLLTQYNIPVPAKLPYAVEPRIDKLVEPTVEVTPTNK
jgi:Flp pilus assembly protein CpaB